jgi:hypothetical protein
VAGCFHLRCGCRAVCRRSAVGPGDQAITHLEAPSDEPTDSRSCSRSTWTAGGGGVSSAWKPCDHPGRFEDATDLDLMARAGRVLLVELKRRTGRPTGHQAVWATEIGPAGYRLWRPTSISAHQYIRDGGRSIPWPASTDSSRHDRVGLTMAARRPIRSRPIRVGLRRAWSCMLTMAA